MEGSVLVTALTSFLIPFIPYLDEAGRKTPKGDTSSEAHQEERRLDSYAMEKAHVLWKKLTSGASGSTTKSALSASLRDLQERPFDEDAKASLRLQLRKTLQQRPALSEEIDTILSDLAQRSIETNPLSEFNTVKWLDILNGYDDVLRRLEMIRLLRTGIPAEQIAAQFHTDTGYLFRVHSAFTVSGVYGILSGSNIRHWLDNLDHHDPLLRRLDIIRLMRAGAPVEVIAREYHTTKEYVYRLSDRFSRNGSVAVLTEDDFDKYRYLHPPYIRICSFNLHGTHDDAPGRLKRVAGELNIYDPELCVFQEVINGANIADTGAEIARWMTDMTGYYYRTHYAYCHLYMDRYPEGVSVCAKSELKNTSAIDLNTGLPEGLAPLMPRFAATAETVIYGRRVVFACLHLDHHENPQVRQAQAEKLLTELERIYGPDTSRYCTILAGDFNDVEDSLVIDYLKEKGYLDTYRSKHAFGGNTFTTIDPFTRIDYIMVKGDVKIHNAQLILNNPQLSDHIGLYAVIE